MWAPLASGSHHGSSLAVAFVLVGIAAAIWLAAGLLAGRLEWRRTPLDLPALLLLGLIAGQLALGNRALVAWALAPAQPVEEVAAAFPAPWLTVGTVAPRDTATAALIFVGELAVYGLVVQTIRTRRQIGRLVSGLLLVGAAVAFLGLVAYLTGDTWLPGWRDESSGARLSGPFVNPDHFAAWLAMLVVLGVGWMTARAPRFRHLPSLATQLYVRELREEMARRFLPLVGVVVMAVALVFTLSRGGLLNIVTALLALLAMLGAVRWVRRSLLVTCVLLVVMLGYGGWIGFGPVLERVSTAPAASVQRAGQYLASLPMLREFPVLGVGLGAYREVYFRHQPLAHQPDILYFPYAPNDLLQLALELGPAGALLALYLAWRVGADLVGTHLLGRGACPVDGGEGTAAMRRDRLSVGVAIGALAGTAGLVAHSALDFSARMPAVGLLAAALLGLATVSLHTRLSPGREQLLSASVTWPLGWPTRVMLGVVGLAAAAAWTWAWVQGAQVWTAERALADAPPTELAERAEAVLALDPRNPDALLVRARLSQRAGLAAWESQLTPGEDRRRLARERLAQARADLRTALSVTPTNPWLHLDLAWVEASDATVQAGGGAGDLEAALSHGARAVALGLDSPLLYAGMARLAYSVPELGLRAARGAVARRPALLGEMIDLYRPLGLLDTDWLELAPPTPLDRLELAVLLEARGLRAESLTAFRAALAAAPPAGAAPYAWALGEALGRSGQPAEAVSVLRQALRVDAGNPELERALGAALARQGDPEALAHLRAAVTLMGRREGVLGEPPFARGDPRLRRIVAVLAADLDRTLRYRRALATYLTERALWDQALIEWRALVADEPNDAESRFGLGLSREATGAVEAAVESFRAAVELDPTSARYRRRLAERLWQSEQFFQAIIEWRALTERQPRDVQARLALGRAYERVGQATDAYREYRQVLTLEPAQADATRAVARLEGRRP